MGNTMIIRPSVFELLFYFAILLGGLDFALSGFQVLRENTRPLGRPRLLGLLIIRAMHVSDASQKHNRLFLLMFSPKTMGAYTFLYTLF
jgi:hypothetical protein